ncbi:DUF6009 family protein [Streptomyces ossamyceticus]|nr:DUF6009 family protein [Streptomyces ossamyceticus]
MPKAVRVLCGTGRREGGEVKRCGLESRRDHTQGRWTARSIAAQERTCKRIAPLLDHEDHIVWIEEVEAFDYVRQSVSRSVSSRSGPVAWTGAGRRVGYAVLRHDAPSGAVPGRYVRRVFWVKDHDRSEQPNGIYRDSAPSGAVDPRTVAPGVWGELTEHAWGTPFPPQA